MEKIKNAVAALSLVVILGGLGYLIKWQITESVAAKKVKEEQKTKQWLLELQRDLILAPVRREHQIKLEQAEKEALAKWYKEHLTPAEYEEYLRSNRALESLRLQTIEEIKKHVSDERVLEKMINMLPPSAE